MSVQNRLREERKRLGLTLAQMAQAGGSNARSYSHYEAGERFADTEFMAAIAAKGADVQYIVTGQRSAQALSRDEVELLAAFRAAPLAVKAAAMGALQGGSAPPKTKSIKVNGDGNQSAVVGGNQNLINQSQGGMNGKTDKKPRCTD